jgi:hypothetical protein
VAKAIAYAVLVNSIKKSIIRMLTFIQLKNGSPDLIDIFDVKNAERENSNMNSKTLNEK